MKLVQMLIRSVLIGLMVTAPVSAESMIDWDSLPVLPYQSAPNVLPEMTNFVAGEYRTRHCPTAPVVNGRFTVRVDVAVLLDAQGSVRAAIPHAINCVTVEQYVAGIVAAAARNNLQPRAQGAEGWYRTSMTFDWAK